MNSNPRGTIGDLGDDGYDRERRAQSDDGSSSDVADGHPVTDWDPTVYASVVRAASAVATCAHGDPALVKLAGRFLTAEFKRWGELSSDDE